MKKFLLHLCFFAALIIAALSGVTRFTDLRLRARSTGRMKAWYNIAQGRINADILILGSSHAHVQVNPRIIAAAFPGQSVYNLGLDGYTFDIQLARYQFYRRYNKKPKLLIVCLDYFEFSKSKWEADRVQFLPYLYDTAIQRGLKSIGFSQVKCYAPFLKYRGEGNAVRAAMTNASPLHDDDNERPGFAGFEPRDFSWKEDFFLRDVKNKAHTTPSVDSAIWRRFLQFRQECKNESVAVCAAFTPHQFRYLERVTGASAYRDWLRAAIGRQTYFFDFSLAQFCGDTSCFYNGTHVNAGGADVFSAALADSLLENYKP